MLVQLQAGEKEQDFASAPIQVSISVQLWRLPGCHEFLAALGRPERPSLPPAVPFCENSISPRFCWVKLAESWGLGVFLHVTPQMVASAIPALEHTWHMALLPCPSARHCGFSTLISSPPLDGKLLDVSIIGSQAMIKS